LQHFHSEDYPLMTVGELARALGVPREFVYRHAAELGAICLRLPDNNGRYSAKFERGGPLRFPRSAGFALQ
jgi:DNA-binding IclR family transcriptional regulator